MRFEEVSQEDLPLYLQMFCDAEYMKYLGGPNTPEAAESMLKAHIRYHSAGKGMTFKIIPDVEDWPETERANSELVASGQLGVGTVCIWQSEYKDEPCVEMGWGVARVFQGRGFGAKAVRLLLEKAREDRAKWTNIHVFTDVNNEASIRLCNSLGFIFEDECEVDYNDKMFPARHYRVEL